MKKNTPKVPQKPAPPARAETRKGRQDDSNTALWRPPLQRHLTKDKKVHHITIRVRIFAGDIIHDFNAKFQPSKHLPAQAVCDVIAKREGLSDHAKTMFALWVVGRDLELQLRPNLNLFDFIPKWHVWMQKYTHLPECKTATHPTNRHWFVFRREALFSKTLERKVTEENAIKLFYGEAKHNVTSGRYPCTEEDVVTLAALQLQSATGDHDSSKHYTGYLTGENVLEQYIPAYMIKKLSRHDWEVAIFDEHLKFKGKSSAIAKLLYLQYVRQWSFYGATFFPISQEIPPEGFFEFRTKAVLLGVTTEHLMIIDLDKHKLVFEISWHDATWSFSSDMFIIKYTKPGNKEAQMRLITPQAPIIHNVSQRANHLLKKVAVLLEELRRQQELQASLNPSQKVTPSPSVDHQAQSSANQKQDKSSQNNGTDPPIPTAPPPALLKDRLTMSVSGVKALERPISGIDKIQPIPAANEGSEAETNISPMTITGEQVNVDDLEIPKPANFKRNTLKPRPLSITVTPLSGVFSPTSPGGPNRTQSVRRATNSPLPYEQMHIDEVINEVKANRLGSAVDKEVLKEEAHEPRDETGSGIDWRLSGREKRRSRIGSMDEGTDSPRRSRLSQKGSYEEGDSLTDPGTNNTQTKADAETAMRLSVSRPKPTQKPEETMRQLELALRAISMDIPPEGSASHFDLPAAISEESRDSSFIFDRQGSGEDPRASQTVDQGPINVNRQESKRVSSTGMLEVPTAESLRAIRRGNSTSNNAPSVRKPANLPSGFIPITLDVINQPISSSAIEEIKILVQNSGINPQDDDSSNQAEQIALNEEAENESESEDVDLGQGNYTIQELDLHSKKFGREQSARSQERRETMKIAIKEEAESEIASEEVGPDHVNHTVQDMDQEECECTTGFENSTADHGSGSEQSVRPQPKLPLETAHQSAVSEIVAAYTSHSSPTSIRSQPTSSPKQQFRPTSNIRVPPELTQTPSFTPSLSSAAVNRNQKSSSLSTTTTITDRVGIAEPGSPRATHPDSPGYKRTSAIRARYGALSARVNQATDRQNDDI